MILADFVIENADLVATCAGPAPRRGAAQGDIAAIRRASIASLKGEIVFVGAASACAAEVTLDAAATRIDGRGCTVIPGFVDPHTHLVFAGDRRDELQRRLAGASYAEIAAEGGGILRTVTATRNTSEADLLTSARARLDEMTAHGTTTCEAKSGYGLTLESECRQLRVIRTLNETSPVDVVSTFLGAHEIPVEYRRHPDDYVALVAGEMIPRVASERLAEWCDVFCDEGAFTPEQSTTILTAGVKAGLKPRVHADELARSGGAEVAARVGARSADHLIHLDGPGADALGRAGTCAVLLPIAALYLKAPRLAPARMLIERGVPVALGTDLNPGAGYSPSMPFAMTLACFGMQMTVEESLVAATINAAWSLDRAGSVGSLEPGKLCDAVIIDGHLTELLHVGRSPIRTVIKRGHVIAGRR
jgi:imidazolonepropionase